MEIARMQAVINENIARQAETLDNIYAQVVDAVDTIAEANKQLEQSAEKISSGAWNMFLFIMLCTFILLLYHVMN